MLSKLIEPGFFSSAPVQTALLVGGLAAAVSSIVGVFTVVRGNSFAGHSLADIGAAGGSGALLAGVQPLFGFIAINVVAAAGMEAMGTRRPRGRDVATGIVLGAALGVTALFLYLVTTTSSTTGATISVLFGSLFTFDPSLAPVVAALAALSIGTVLLLYRPLLLASMSEDLATTRGIPVRSVGVSYLAALAIAVSLSAITVGAILSTALLVGPAATALRLTNRAGTAIALAPALGICETWLGTLLAYDSYYWFPSHPGLPVSFFVVCAVFVVYLAVQSVSAVSRWGPGVRPLREPA